MEAHGASHAAGCAPCFRPRIIPRGIVTQLPDRRRQLLTLSLIHTPHRHRLGVLTTSRRLARVALAQPTRIPSAYKKPDNSGPQRRPDLSGIEPVRQPGSPLRDAPTKLGPAVDPPAITASGRAPSLLRRTSQGHNSGRPRASAHPQWTAGKAFVVMLSPAQSARRHRRRVTAQEARAAMGGRTVGHHTSRTSPQSARRRRHRRRRRRLGAARAAAGLPAPPPASPHTHPCRPHRYHRGWRGPCTTPALIITANSPYSSLGHGAGGLGRPSPPPSVSHAQAAHASPSPQAQAPAPVSITSPICTSAMIASPAIAPCPRSRATVVAFASRIMELRFCTATEISVRDV